jgi:hypothetical protein
MERSRVQTFDDELSESGDKSDSIKDIKTTFIGKVIVNQKNGTRTNIDNNNNEEENESSLDGDSPNGKKNKKSPPRPPASSTPSRIVAGSRPKTGQRIQNSTTTQQPNLTNVPQMKQVNLENRILIRLANILPQEETPSKEPKPAAINTTNPSATTTHHHPPPTNSHQHSAHHTSEFNKLPESRNMLLRLNDDLDDLIAELRKSGMTGDKFNFGDLSGNHAVKDPATENGVSLDNNPFVFDQVIAELASQASKKVQRIKKAYKTQFIQLKKRHEDQVVSLRLKVEELSSKLFENQVSTNNINDIINSAEKRLDQAKQNDAVGHYEKLVKVMREEQDNMQLVLMDRLEHERKVC